MVRAVVCLILLLIPVLVSSPGQAQERCFQEGAPDCKQPRPGQRFLTYKCEKYPSGLRLTLVGTPCDPANFQKAPSTGKDALRPPQSAPPRQKGLRIKEPPSPTISKREGGPSAQCLELKRQWMEKDKRYRRCYNDLAFVDNDANWRSFCMPHLSASDAIRARCPTLNRNFTQFP